MKDRTILKMIDESRSIYRALVFWTAVFVPCVFVLVNPAMRDDLLLLSFAATAGIVAFVAGALSIVRVSNLNDRLGNGGNGPDKPTGQPRRARRTITINSAHGERARLEVTDTDSNIIYLGEYGLRRAEWHRLTTTLRDNPKGRWNWSRSILIDTGIFSGLTVGNRYNDVTQSFEDARAVKANRDGAGKIMNAHVTGKGIEALHAAAGMRVVTSGG